MLQAIADSRSKEPKGVDHFVEEMVREIGPEMVTVHKLAWTKLTELLVILDKGADDFSMYVADLLTIMQYLITSSVCIKDSTVTR